MALDDEWMTKARCREVENPDPIFFPRVPKGIKPDYRRAKGICHQCPVRRTCLAYAIAHSESQGVWGGLSPNERRAIPLGIRMKIREHWKSLFPPSRYQAVGGR